MHFLSASHPTRIQLLAAVHVIFLGLTGAVAAQEDLSAPPVVTAPAWVFVDPRTQQILASVQGDEPRKSASTTKLMCALVVLNLAEKDPAVLEERTTISKLADATDGSTAGVKAGERVAVRDALYGLLLPSGNDLGNALAEHFNPRLQPPGSESPAALAEDAYRTRRNFVAEMNRTAARLGMKHTRYFLPYGDGGKPTDRTTTAHDLALLACKAMENPLLKRIVATRTHKAQIGGTDGKDRSLTWTNTNQLLKQGYDGVKTGMTRAAGYCLIASGEQDGRPLVAVILGAPTEASRYADTRNLMRWWWAKSAPAAASRSASSETSAQ